MVRYAFTMIELIFALVIMGIVFLTLPRILIEDSSNVEQNIMQEAIFASSAKIGQILTFHWDENSPDPTTTLTAANVVGTPNGDPELDRVAGTDFRLGHIVQPLHRRMTSITAERNATTIVGLGVDDVIDDPDDIDDFDGGVNLDLITGTSVSSYKKAYRVTTDVSYVSDAADYTQSTINYTFDVGSAATVTSDRNVKMIELSTDQNNSGGWSVQPILVLRAFSANIGETDFYKRTY